ncbi:MAG: class I adenylate-forming enzyme family protein [Albidovulum sp.]
MLSVTVPKPFCPCPAPFNLAQYVLAAADTCPDRVALAILGASDAEEWSYGRLKAAVLGVAAGLLAQGLEPGDRILLRIGNGVAFPLAFLGAVAAGIVPVPTASTLTKSEAEKLCAIVRPELIVAGRDIALPRASDCHVLFDTDLLRFEHLPPADYAMGDPDRLAYIVFTSGTSDHPRAIAHAHRAVWARRMMVGGWTGVCASDRLLHAGALNWTYTLGTGLFDPWVAGATAMVLASDAAPTMLPTLAARHHATIIAAVPGLYRRILRDTSLPNLPRLRHGLSAGEKLPAKVRSDWNAATGTDLHEAMGMTECSTFLSSSPKRPAPAGSTGYAQPGRQIAVLGANGAPVECGTPGMLAIHRSDPGLCLGQFKMGTVRPISADWFETGDIVQMDSDGSIVSLGRADDVITAGGYRIAPSEIETALNSHPAVLACAAMQLSPRPDTRLIGVFFQGDVCEDVLRDHLKSRLAPYKHPHIYIATKAIPLSPNGKVNRRALREEWKEKV